MKKWILASLVSACLPFMAMAQVADDLYYVPKKKEAVKKTEKKVETSPVESQPVQTTNVYAVPGTTVVVKDAAGEIRDVDEYNRRYTSRENTFSFNNDTLVVQEKPYTERGEWVGGEFVGSQSDYEYAMRIVRFRNPRYAIPVSSPLYWDVVYGGMYPSWDWNVYDDGMYAYVFPTYTNRLWWDWRWNSYGPGWGFSMGWTSPWYYSWYSPYYCEYWGGYWGPGWHHHHYPYYGGWYGGHYGWGRPADRNPSGRYHGTGSYQRPNSGVNGGRYSGGDAYRRPNSGLALGRTVSTGSGIRVGNTTGGRNYSSVRTDQTGRVRSTGRVVNPTSNSDMTSVRPVNSGVVNRTDRTDPRRNISSGTVNNAARSAYSRPNSYIRPSSSSTMEGTRSTYTRPSSTRSSVNRTSTRSYNRSDFNNSNNSSYQRSSSSSSFRSSGSSYSGGGRSTGTGGGGGRSSGGGRR